MYAHIIPLRCSLFDLVTVYVHTQNVSMILRKYAGKERKLLEHLRKKYTEADDPTLPAYDFYSVIQESINFGILCLLFAD